MNSSVFIVFASLFIVTSCNTNTSTDGLLGAVKNALPDAVDFAKNSLNSKDGNDLLSKIPSSLDDINLPPGINKSALPSIEEGEDVMRKKCLKNGKNDSFEIAMQAKDDLQYCIKGLVDFDSVQAEIEKYKPTGDLDIVFKKYCRKMPILKECVSNFTTAVDPCLDEGEKMTKKLLMNVTDSLDKFICYKEGDRIALFIAEGGPECLADKQEALQHCVNQTFSKHIPSETPDVNSLPEFKLEEPQCRDIYHLQRCVVEELEKCSEPTPANIVESLFNFVRQSTPCHTYKMGATASSSFVIQSSYSFVLLGLLSVFLIGICQRSH